MLRTTLVALFTLVLTTFTQAHEITPTIINAEITTQGTLRLQLDTNLEALMVGVGSDHEDTDDSPLAAEYNALRALPVNELEARARTFSAELVQRLNFVDQNKTPTKLPFELETLSIEDNSDLEIARESVLSYSTPLPASLTGLALSWPEELGNFIFRLTVDGNLKGGLYVMAGEQSDLLEFDVVGSQNQGFLEYIVIGFEHIIPLVLDHILFVIGIYLLSQSLRALLWQVSAFTLAHTLTLALATLGLVSVPASIVEPLIALSISYVAIENIFKHKLSRGRIALIFGFGLLHGLGFAGVLGEIGLNPDAFLSSLIAFNVGVELGQLAVIALMFALLGFWLGKSAYWERWVRIPISLLIALVGLYWFVERIL